MNNYALYYPSIEFNNRRWLWNASLLWDRIYRIVPSGYQPDDGKEISALVEQGEIGIPISPGVYAQEVAAEFMRSLKKKRWNAAALSSSGSEGYDLLHGEKVDVALRKMIISRGGGKSVGEWLSVPTDFAAHYMTYLANAVAKKNNLQMLSDNVPAWTSSTYFKLDGNIEEFPNNDLTHQLATMVIKDFLPENVQTLKPKSILAFREKHREERQQFLTSIQDHAKKLANCTDEKIGRDVIQDMKKDIEKSLKDYRDSLAALNVSSMTGMKSISFPVATNVALLIGGAALSTANLLVVSALGIGLGLVSGISDRKQKKKNLNKECDYSYLIHMNNNWKKHAKYNNDYNYNLCRSLEEFVND